MDVDKRVTRISSDFQMKSTSGEGSIDSFLFEIYII